ncbi:MAG: V-type ATP synthase subunit E [Trueperaceae bacterium]
MANLAALLEKEASAEIEAMLSEARSRASEIVSGAKTEADEILKQRDYAAKSQSEAALVRAKSAAQLEASSLRLRAQQTAIESVFEGVKAKLSGVTSSEAQYAPVLEKLMKEALAGMGGAANVASVVVNTKDKALAEKIAAGLGLTGKVSTSDSVQGGVRLQGNNSISVENTLHGRLNALREELASEVSKILLPQG